MGSQHEGQPSLAIQNGRSATYRQSKGFPIWVPTLEKGRNLCLHSYIEAQLWQDGGVLVVGTNLNLAHEVK